MATKKLSSIVNKTNRQWAWQFLRRNRVYRDAFAFFASLREDQRAVFEKLVRGQLDSYAENWSQLGSLPVKLFDRNYLWNEKDENKTLDEYVKSSSKRFVKSKKNYLSIAEDVDDLILRVMPEFRADQYGLFEWIDPGIEEMTAEQADAIWFYSVPMEASLVRAPWLDDKDISFEKSDWKGVSREVLLGIKEAVEIDSGGVKNKIKGPVQSEILPLKKGINGAIFIMDNFSAPPSFHPVDGQRIPIGRDPEPLSLNGDTLVRATFDVRLPIEYQIEAVKNYLAEQQKELQEAGFIDALPSRKGRQGVFASYVAILDLHEQGVSDLDIAIKLRKLEREIYTDAQGKEHKSYVDPIRPDLATSQEHTSAIRKQLERARRLRDHGYRSLALQMD